MRALVSENFQKVVRYYPLAFFNRIYFNTGAIESDTLVGSQ